MKYGPFPMWPAFPTSEYYDPLRLPLDHPMPLPGFAGYRPGIASLAPQATGSRRLSRVPRTTVRAFSAHIRRRVLQRPLLEQERFPWPSPCADGLGSLSFRPKAGSLTTLAQASHVLQTARLIPPRFAPGLSTTHGGITTGDPGVSPDRTHTGRPP